MSAILLQQHLVITCYNLTTRGPQCLTCRLFGQWHLPCPRCSPPRASREISRTRPAWKTINQALYWNKSHIRWMKMQWIPDYYTDEDYLYTYIYIYIYIYMRNSSVPGWRCPKKNVANWGNLLFFNHRRVHLVSSRQLSGSQIASAAACSSLCWTPMRSWASKGDQKGGELWWQSNQLGYGSVSKHVKTLYPCSSHQNSWVKMDVHPPKNGMKIGIDPYPYVLLPGLLRGLSVGI